MICHFASLSSESQTRAFISTRSIMPLKLSSEPIGSCTTSGRAPRRVLDHVHAAHEVRARAVHLVHVADARHVVVVSQAPVRLRLRLHARHAVEHHDRAVEHAQRTVHFDGEVHVPGGVDDVDLLLAPERRDGRRLNRDAALLFLLHVVRRRRRLQILGVVDVDDRVLATRVIKDALGRGGLTGIDVRDDSDVANVSKGRSTGHCKFPLKIQRVGGPKPGL